MTPATVRVPIGKVDGRITRRQEDILAVEEPLEIRVGSRSLSVTMRTPGHDFELAAGFLFAEDIISSAAQIRGMTNSRPNVVVVELSPDAVIKSPPSQRAFVMTSACGRLRKSVTGVARSEPVSGSSSKRSQDRCRRDPSASASTAPGGRTVFESTGGLHAAALFNPQGELESLREDVGRHNAVDKLVGHALLRFRTPLRDSVMLVSGRASFELVQKASMAGVPLLAAVGAPSSLAVATAERCGMTLIGFLRNGGFNVYSGGGRIEGLENPQ